MSTADLAKIVLGLLASVGGISGIMLTVIRFSANIIAKRLEEKYSLKLNKKLEEYKSKLDSKNYISKTKFDTEFKIYRDLSKSFFEAVKNISILIPNGFAQYPADEEARRKYENDNYSEANKSVVLAQDVLNSNIPFIPDAFYKNYNEILKLCRWQLNAFSRRWNKLYLGSQEDKETFSSEDYERTNEINNKFNELNSCIRDYLSNLDVLD